MKAINKLQFNRKRYILPKENENKFRKNSQTKYPQKRFDEKSLFPHLMYTNLRVIFYKLYSQKTEHFDILPAISFCC